uniref:Putative F-box/kelch-repeat protein SKIP25-like n=1 Tax=Davidia involucrata TaxID=16924 RepID=A0A5B7BK29_DAVIN
MTNPITTASTTSTATAASGSTSKRQKLADQSNQDSLLPGLPDHIAQLCLSLVHPSLLYSVCRSWRRLIYSPSFPPFLSLYALLLPTQTAHHHSDSDSIEFFSFDPISSKWYSLPPLPPYPPLHILLRHPSFISRNLPIQSVAVSGNLVLLAATTHHFIPALPRPLIFSTLSQKWAFGPPLATPRRWCVTGASRAAVYVASGVGSRYSLEVARSVEKWDLQKNHCHHYHNNNKTSRGWNWEKMGGLRDGKFSRDAIDAIGWRRRLCMVNVKGNAAKEGVVYDIEKDSWEEMPDGMLAGWRGPAAAMDEDTIYVVDESKGALRRYDPDNDGWVEILESERLRGAEHMVAAGGRVCVVCGGGDGIVAVDVVALPPKLWVVDTPPGYQAIAVHILPRISLPDFQPPVLTSTSMK